MHLGRVAGIDIGAHWSALIIAALLGYTLSTAVLPAGAPDQPLVAYVLVAAAVAVLFLAGLLAHELAHSLVARRYGVGVRRITLWLLGGVSELDGDPPTPRAEFLIAAAGPFVSLLFGGLAAGGAALANAASAGQLLGVALAWLAGVNLLLGVFNLLPGAPLDGGRIARALVWRVRGDRDRAQIAADRAGVVLGVLLAAIGVLQILLGGNLSGFWLVLLGWFLVSAANAEIANVRLNRALDGRTVRDIMAEPVSGHANQSVDTFVTGTAARHPHGHYPVVDDDGRPIGLVHLSDLVRIPAVERPRLPLRAAATPPTEAVPTVAADDPASTAVQNLSPANPLLAVTDHDRLVGVVAPGDLTHAITLAGLSRPGSADPRSP